MIELGRRVEGTTKYMVRECLTESVPGRTYEIHISTKGISNERLTADSLVRELAKKKIEVVWIRIEGSRIRLQIKGSPFAWAILLAMLPLILFVIGVTVIAISIFLLEGQPELVGIVVGGIIILVSLVLPKVGVVI